VSGLAFGARRAINDPQLANFFYPDEHLFPATAAIH
jgi:hypothetical protein